MPIVQQIIDTNERMTIYMSIHNSHIDLTNAITIIGEQLAQTNKQQWDTVRLHVRKMSTCAENIEGLEFELEVLEYDIRKLYRYVCIGFELAGLDKALDLLHSEWQEMESNLRELHFVPEVDNSFSLPLSMLQTYTRGLKMAAGPKVFERENYEIELLERLLKSTAVRLRKREIYPSCEADIQRVMDDYLQAIFVDYVPQFTIPGHIKHFKPDGGIMHLQAAIEFKFVNSGARLKTALSGIFEDAAGYNGTEDWKRFYSVIYMTEPFETEDRFAQDLLRGGLKGWQAILVNS